MFRLTASTFCFFFLILYCAASILQIIQLISSWIDIFITSNSIFHLNYVVLTEQTKNNEACFPKFELVCLGLFSKLMEGCISDTDVQCQVYWWWSRTWDYQGRTIYESSSCFESTSASGNWKHFLVVINLLIKTWFKCFAICSSYPPWRFRITLKEISHRT